MGKKNRSKYKQGWVTEHVMNDRARALAKHLASTEVRFLKRLTLAGKISFDFQVAMGFYIADFVFPTKMLIIELDGSSHRKPSQKLHDEKRDEYLRKIGFTVWRIPNSEAMIFDLDKIYEFAETPGYSDSLKAARKVYCQAVAPQESTPPPGESYYERTARERTERTQARSRNRKNTDLTPRLLKKTDDNEWRSFPFGENNPTDPENLNGAADPARQLDEV